MDEKRKVARSFFLGLVLGGALVYTGTHVYRHWFRAPSFWRGGMQSPRMLAQLSRKLGLSAEQKAQVEKILETRLPEIRNLREGTRPQFEAVRRSIQSDIRAVLDAEQRIKFDELERKFEERRKKWEEKMERGK